MKKCKVLLIAALAALAGCNLVNDLVHDDQVVAKACGEKLYLSVLSQYIPDGLTPEDSTRLALQYINSWASDILFKHTAEAQLSKEDKDVSKELEDYRKSLLKYRYQQKYIAEHLDSLVTPEEISGYYEANPDKFRLPDGTLQPVDSCARWIEDIILGIRKHALTIEMEQQLVESARENSQFIVY